MSVRQQPATGDGSPGDRLDFPLSDAPLLDLLDALVNDRGRVAAAEALGVNYRTMMACYDSRRISRRMRKGWRSSGTRVKPAGPRLTMTARRTRWRLCGKG